MKSTLTVQSLQLLLFFDSNLSTWGSPLLVIKVSRFLKVISGSRNSIITLTFTNLAVTRVFFYQLKKPHFADLIWKQPALQWNLQRYSKQIWMIACRSSVKDLKWAKCFVRNMFKLRWFYFPLHSLYRQWVSYKCYHSFISRLGTVISFLSLLYQTFCSAARYVQQILPFIKKSDAHGYFEMNYDANFAPVTS